MGWALIRRYGLSGGGSGRSGTKKVNKVMVGQNLGNIEAEARRGEGDSICKRDEKLFPII